MNKSTSKGARLQKFLPTFLIILAAVLFEVFNFTTTEFALTDMIGELGLNFSNVWSLPLATILAIGFCMVDFAGIACIFAPQQGRSQSKEIWLYGAWFLASLMNAVLTWWAVSSMVLQHQGVGVLSRESVIKIVPILAATVMWTIRFFSIGALAVFTDELIHQGETISRSTVPSSTTIEEQPSWFKKTWARLKQSLSGRVQKAFNRTHFK